MRATTSILVILGPTASGKSRLALGVAEDLGGEIVSADAFAVYRGMNIGTATPLDVDQQRIPHHLIDILDPHETFSAGDFVIAADQAISEIREKGAKPIIVGGTHFYIRALLSGLFPAPPQNDEIRTRLATEWDRDRGTVFERLNRVDATADARIGAADRQRILRALEIQEITGLPISSHWRNHPKTKRYNAVVVAPHRPRDELYARIDERVDRMFSAGLVDEVSQILASGTPRDSHALKAIGYREVVEVLEENWSVEEAIHHTKKATRRLAKRQLTWLRHHDQEMVHWVSPDECPGIDEIVSLVRTSAN
ncbi:MAG: tRNA (adenosine(37)-N6)-dimethylallyltransferase MiaA [Thermoanaerobaculales bacterium]|nr:tRNA (adenosine(37)-N6)-dimethylallyltransferase MiaA [Thermoanaerobaculales bacterium]